VYKTLLIFGLALTLVGALGLSLRELRGGSSKLTIDEMERGFPRALEAWMGFPLIALGTALQIAGVATS
jgi:hypothetical protein